MTEAAVELKVAGQTYRVVTSADQQELGRLAAVVEDALVGVTAPGRRPSADSLILAAVSLAHELEQEREKFARLQAQHRKMLQRVLATIDGVIGAEPQKLHDASRREEPFGRAEECGDVAALSRRTSNKSDYAKSKAPR